MAAFFDPSGVFGVSSTPNVPTQFVSAEAIAAKRKLAEALLGEGSDYSPANWAQGLARISHAIRGGLEERSARADEAANRSIISGDESILGGGDTSSSTTGDQTAAPTGGANAASMVAPDTFKAALRAAGIKDDDPMMPYYVQMAGKESSFNPNAVSKTGAKGYFQFTQGTGKTYGLFGPKGEDLRADPTRNIQAMVAFTNANKAGLAKALGREPTLGELALAHQQGLGGATSLLSGQSVAPGNLAANGINPRTDPRAAAAAIQRFYGFGGQEPVVAGANPPVPAQTAAAPAAAPAPLPAGQATESGFTPQQLQNLAADGTITPQAAAAAAASPAGQPPLQPGAPTAAAGASDAPVPAPALPAAAPAPPVPTQAVPAALPAQAALPPAPDASAGQAAVAQTLANTPPAPAPVLSAGGQAVAQTLAAPDMKKVNAAMRILAHPELASPQGLAAAKIIFGQYQKSQDPVAQAEYQKTLGDLAAQRDARAKFLHEQQGWPMADAIQQAQLESSQAQTARTKQEMEIAAKKAPVEQRTAEANAAAAEETQREIPDRAKQAAAKTVSDEADAAIKQAQQGMPGKWSMQQATDLRDKIAATPEYQSYSTALSRYNSMMDSLKKNAKDATGASDLTQLYGMSKMFDPTTGVQTGDRDLVAGVGSFMDRIKGMIDSVKGGSKMTPEVRLALAQEANTLMNGYKRQFEARTAGMMEQAKYQNMPPEVMKFIAPGVTEMADIPNELMPPAPPPETTTVPPPPPPQVTPGPVSLGNAGGSPIEAPLAPNMPTSRFGPLVPTQGQGQGGGTPIPPDIAKYLGGLTDPKAKALAIEKLKANNYDVGGL